ncbi:hypothetical protein N184_35885 [Sinorhizobium sp. GL28]|nr:hypothetical protein N184_35885 [Sinorhizobium sp. GL28]
MASKNRAFPIRKQRGRPSQIAARTVGNLLSFVDVLFCFPGHTFLLIQALTRCSLRQIAGSATEQQSHAKRSFLSLNHYFTQLLRQVGDDPRKEEGS